MTSFEGSKRLRAGRPVENARRQLTAADAKFGGGTLANLLNRLPAALVAKAASFLPLMDIQRASKVEKSVRLPAHVGADKCVLDAECRVLFADEKHAGDMKLAVRHALWVVQ